MEIPEVFLAVLDPAERYMRRRAGWLSGREPLYFRGTVDGRQATDAEVAFMHAQLGQAEDRARETLEEVAGRWGALATRCAVDVIAEGSAVMPVDAGTVSARLVRFWRGDDVLVIESSRDDDPTSAPALAKVPRDVGVETVAECLLGAVARLAKAPGLTGPVGDVHSERDHDQGQPGPAQGQPGCDPECLQGEQQRPEGEEEPDDHGEVHRV